VQSAHADDSRGLRPNASEPQSEDIGFCVLPNVAKPAYLSRIVCWWSHTVAACCAPGGVSSGVNQDHCV
jgi:hypothetical protein